jgi:phage tail-like protein
MAISGQAKNYDVEANFRVRIDGFQDTDFAECTSLKAAREFSEYWSGGEATAHKQATGKVTFPDITLSRGVCADYDVYELFSRGMQLTAAMAGADAVGVPFPEDRINMEICQKDVDGSFKRVYTVQASVSEFEAGQWKGDSKNVVVEKMTFKVHGWDLTG